MLGDPEALSSEYGLRDDACVWVDQWSVGSGSQFEPHVHPQTQLSWVERGQLLVSTADRRWVLPPSQAIWIPGDVEHEIRVLRDSRLYCVYLWDEECHVPWRGTTILSMAGLARELVRHLARPDLEDSAARHARSTLLSVLEPAGASSVDLPMPVDPRAFEVAAGVLELPSEPHRLGDWAARLHTSEKTIQRAFLAETGMPFSAWRTQARLHRALPMLADEMPVSAVAARIGYTSANGFTAAFRRHFGTTPGMYYPA